MDDALPPLTQVIRRYVPRWAAFAAIYGIWGAAVAHWLNFSQWYVIAVAAAFLGWLTDHFDVTYDKPVPGR